MGGIELKNTYIVYNLNLMEHLIRKGYGLIGISPNKHCEGKFVFFFNDNDGRIEYAVNQYKNQIA